jgi:hypothetical protein
MFRCCEAVKTVLGADRNCSDVMIGKGGNVASGFESRLQIYHEKDERPKGREVFVLTMNWVWCLITSDCAFTKVDFV